MCSKKTIGGARGQMEGQRDSTRSKGTIEGAKLQYKEQGNNTKSNKKI